MFLNGSFNQNLELEQSNILENKVIHLQIYYEIFKGEVCNFCSICGTSDILVSLYIQGSLLFVTYTIIQGIISSEMEVYIYIYIYTHIYIYIY